MEETEFGSLLHLEGSLPDRCVVILKRRTIDKIEEPVMKCIARVGAEVGGATANAKLEEEGGTAMEKVRRSFAARSEATSWECDSFGRNESPLNTIIVTHF